jgi:hypothetical protein
MDIQVDRTVRTKYFVSNPLIALIFVLVCISTFLFGSDGKKSKQSRLGGRAPAVLYRYLLGKRQPRYNFILSVPFTLRYAG